MPDAILWGTLRDIRLVDAPTLHQGGDYVGSVRPVCSGHIDPAIDLELEVEHTLRGALPGTVIIRLGAEHRSGLAPRPRTAAGGAPDLEWSSNSETAGEPLVVGRKLGAPVHLLSSGRASLMGHLLFGVQVREDGGRAIRFQPVHGGCDLPGPTAFDGRTLAEMQAIIDACPADSESATRLRTARLNTWGPPGASPSRYLAANCFPL